MFYSHQGCRGLGGFALAVLAVGCPDLDEGNVEAARAAVATAFASAHPSGRTGVEVLGKSVWLEAPMFDRACLESKHLAFNDDASIRPVGSPQRITPTYQNQRYFTASTERGYCIYLGDSPVLQIDAVSPTGDRYSVAGTILMSNPTPWFECLNDTYKKLKVDVAIDDAGAARVEGAVDALRGACPVPLPEGESRGPGRAAPKTAHAAPTRAEVTALVEEFDAALVAGDFGRVKDLTACYNLEEEGAKYDNCSVAEFISVGPAFGGEPRPQDGTPWTEYVFSSTESLRQFRADPELAGVFHVPVLHERTRRDRSFSVQWVDGRWKMVGVIGRQAESLTAVRYMYDLHRAEKRSIFGRRLAGESLDEAGNSLTEETEDE